MLEGCDDNDERDCQNNLKTGILGFELHSDGAGQSKLCLPYSGPPRSIGRNGNQEITSGAYAPITMEGKEARFCILLFCPLYLIHVGVRRLSP